MTTQSMHARSGKDIGQRYLEQVRAYLAGESVLPLLATGAVNMTAIADGAGVPRQSLYKNPGIRELIEAAKAAQCAMGARNPAKAQPEPPSDSVEPRRSHRQSRYKCLSGGLSNWNSIT